MSSTSSDSSRFTESPRQPTRSGNPITMAHRRRQCGIRIRKWYQARSGNPVVRTSRRPTFTRNQNINVPQEPTAANTDERATAPASAPSIGSFTNASCAVFDGANSFINAQNFFQIQNSNIGSSSDIPEILNERHPEVPRHLESVSVYQEGVTFSDMSEHPSKAYARLQNRHALGYALYRPQPITSLPPQYRERGVCIGDVGIITPQGAFDSLFNIYLPADDPTNFERTPPGFQPMFPWRLPVEDIDSDHDAWQPGDVRHAGSIWEMPSPSTSNPGLWFEGSASEGAILVLPCGGSRHDLLSTSDVFKYIEVHAEQWYEHINNTRRSGGLGRDAANGALYIITGVDKTQCWGTGAFSGVEGGGKFKLSFRKTVPLAGHVPRFSHAWDPSSIASLRHGPSREHPTPNSETDNPDNQCIFIRGFKIALSEQSWTSLFRRNRLEITTVPHLDSRHRHDLQSSVTQRNGLPSLARMLGFGSSSNQRDNQSSEADDLEMSDVCQSMSDMDPPMQSVHPSDIINAYLLEQNKDARLAVTHDRIWCSAIRDLGEEINSVQDLLERICNEYAMTCTNGVIHFGAELSPIVADPDLEGLGGLVDANQEPPTTVDDLRLESWSGDVDLKPKRELSPTVEGLKIQHLRDNVDFKAELSQPIDNVKYRSFCDADDYQCCDAPGMELVNTYTDGVTQFGPEFSSTISNQKSPSDTEDCMDVDMAFAIRPAQGCATEGVVQFGAELMSTGGDLRIPGDAEDRRSPSPMDVESMSKYTTHQRNLRRGDISTSALPRRQISGGSNLSIRPGRSILLSYPDCPFSLQRRFSVAGTIYSPIFECKWNECTQLINREDFSDGAAYARSVWDHIESHASEPPIEPTLPHQCKWQGCAYERVDESKRNRLRHITTHLPWYRLCERCALLHPRMDQVHDCNLGLCKPNDPKVRAGVEAARKQFGKNLSNVLISDFMAIVLSERG